MFMSFAEELLETTREAINNSKFLLDGSLVLFDCGNDCLEYGDFPVNHIDRYYNTSIIPLGYVGNSTRSAAV